MINYKDFVEITFAIKKMILNVWLMQMKKKKDQNPYFLMLLFQNRDVCTMWTNSLKEKERELKDKQMIWSEDL